MKKFVNDPENFVPDFMAGIAAANPDLLEAIPEHQLIKRRNVDASKVAIVQGSGSGHEPAHVMAVGPGMLTADGVAVRAFGRGFDQLRISPNAMTTDAQVDRFFEALAAARRA